MFLVIKINQCFIQSRLLRFSLICLFTYSILFLNVTLASTASLTSIRLSIDAYKRGDRYSLPLASSWQTDEFNKGPYGPKFQVQLLENGEYILPWIGMPDIKQTDSINKTDINSLLEYVKKNHLPLSIVSTQWESLFSLPEKFPLSSNNRNPNLFPPDTKSTKISATGNLDDWYKTGQLWSTSKFIKDISKILSEPSLVLFLSNNEQPKQEWANVAQSASIEIGIKDNASWEAKRKAIGDRWIGLYQSMFRGFREGLDSLGGTWNKNSFFVGYDALGTSAIGRWPGWIKYSLFNKAYVEPWDKIWDGSSSSYYLYDWNDITDYKVMSPQVESINYLLLLNQIIKPYWFELSVWDGAPKKLKFYKDQNQTFDLCRYKGFMGFGAWQLRPRVIREFRMYSEYDKVDSFNAVLSLVKNVNENAVLKNYWLNGELVENPNYPSVYSSGINEYIGSHRKWYILNANLNKPLTEWKLSDEVNIFAIALKIPKDETYLIYAFSPRAKQTKVNLELPGYGNVNITAEANGSYFEIKNDKVTKISVDNVIPAKNNTITCS